MAGRSNRDVHFWMEHIAKYQGSELTLGEYCRRENIGIHQFYYWRKRLSTTKMDQKSARAVLLSDTGRADNTSQFDSKSVVIQISDGTAVRVPAQLLDTIEAVIKIAQRMGDQSSSTNSVSGFRSVSVR